MSSSTTLRRLPSVDALLRHPDVAALTGSMSRDVVLELVRTELARARTELRAAGKDTPAPPIDPSSLISRIVQRCRRLRALSLQRVVNGTGVVLHTNLGRAPLSRAAQRAMAETAAGYCTLEFDVDSGARGSRHAHLESLLCHITGAEAAVAVNNNAAALLLILSELAAGRDVVVSRGEAVEIGAGFRIPDVLRQSGARLVEVGTTNRTRLADYAAAIAPETAALLHVHTSNFRVVGFTERVPLAELAALGKRHDVVVVDDNGSGCLLETCDFGIEAHLREPTVQESVSAGADVVCFSADKLLGGPQAGVIVGRRSLIERLKRQPLSRALRLDKVAIAGLAATLMHYRLGEAAREVPVWQMIGAPLEDLETRARRWEAILRDAGVRVSVLPERSAIGGGSLPGVTLPTFVVAVAPAGDRSADQTAALLRTQTPAVVGRIVDDRLLFDPRTVLPEDEAPLLAALSNM